MTEELIHGIRKRFVTQDELTSVYDRLMAFGSSVGYKTDEDPREYFKRSDIEYWLLNPDGSKPKEAFDPPV